MLCLVVLAVAAGIAGIVPPVMLQRIIDDALPAKQLSRVITAAAAMLASVFFVEVVAVVQDTIAARVNQSIMNALRMRIFHHLQRVPLSFYTRTPAGEVTNRAINDIDNLGGTLGSLLTTTVGALSMLGSALVTVFVLDTHLAVLAIAMLPIMVLPVPFTTHRAFQDRMRARRARDHLNVLSHEALSLGGTLLARLFGTTDREIERLRQAGAVVAVAEVRLAASARVINGVARVLAIAGPIAIWTVGSVMVIRGEASTGAVVAMGLLLSRLYVPTSQLLNMQFQIASSAAVMHRIREYTEMPAETGGPHPFPFDAADVELYDVVFSYTPDRPVLDHVSLTIRQGEYVGVVGPSGSGKSTLARVLVRVEDPDEGCVIVGGRDVRTIELQQLRAGIALITQDGYLTHGTVEENIRCARPSASRDEIVHAAAVAQLHEVVMALPDGYETVVGELGHRLSGGERQRIALARALLSHASILILDEATNALDRATEELVFQNLAAVCKGRTLITITHRLETLQGADRVYVVTNGRVSTLQKADLFVDRSAGLSAEVEAPERAEMR